MAMSVVYATINGQIVSENRGGVISYYAPDNLGSTVALLDATGTVTDTFTYWPYGEIQSHVGSSITPFTFCGTLGYYTDVLGSQIYVRARYLRQALTRWQSFDPLWPSQRPYSYVDNMPTSKVDWLGLGPLDCEGGPPWWIPICLWIKSHIPFAGSLIAAILAGLDCLTSYEFKSSQDACKDCWQDFLTAIGAIAGAVLAGPTFIGGLLFGGIGGWLGQQLGKFTGDGMCPSGDEEPDCDSDPSSSPEPAPIPTGPNLPGPVLGTHLSA